MKLAELAQIDQLQEADTPIAADGPVEVSDIVKGRSKAMAEKYLRALWGKPRLVHDGKPFFGDGNTVYDDIMGALKVTLKDYEVEKRVEFRAQRVNGLLFDQFDFKTTVDDFQEVYLGFDPSSNSLFVGVDCWVDGEKEFNEVFETEFGEALDVAFDEDDEVHSKIADAAWKAYKSTSMVSILFKVGKELDEELVEDGSFYSKIYRSTIFKRYNLIDLRLD